MVVEEEEDHQELELLVDLVVVQEEQVVLDLEILLHFLHPKEIMEVMIMILVVTAQVVVVEELVKQDLMAHLVKAVLEVTELLVFIHMVQQIQ